MILLLVLLAGCIGAGAVIAARWLDSVAWRRSLVGYRVQLPSKLTPDDVAGWLASLAALTHAPRGALLPPPPVVVEVVADRDGIEHRIHVPRQMTGALLASLRASLPGVRLGEIDATQNPKTVAPVRVAAELRLAGRTRQLGIERAEATSRALLAALQPLTGKESVIWQWIVTGAVTPPPVRVATKSTASPSWLDSEGPADADEVRAARLKQREPILHATGRVVVSADSRAQAYSLFGRVWGPSRMLNVPGARLVRGFWPSSLALDRATKRALPLVRWPLRLNTKELSGLLAFPVGESPLPGVGTGSSRHLPPHRAIPTRGTVLADSTYPGLAQPLAISRRDRTMHMWVGGPTGVGKSTLITNMVVQDMAWGDGLAVLDPKGDLVADILARVPENRRRDVVVLDPADTQVPVGFNVLGTGTTETDRELAVDQVLHVLREQWLAYWGPRTDSVLRAALLTLTHVKAADGSAFTLCEVSELLTNTSFRRWVTAESGVPDSVRQFWRWFESLSDGERTQVIGPVLNKLSAFTQRTPLRLMLGQSAGLDLAQAMRDRKLILVPLSRGRLGAETAGLVGSLLVAGLWQVTLARTSIEASERWPFWLFIDEAQEVVRLPVDIADMLAEARGLGVGMTLANQHLSQLPDPVRRALLSTVRSQVVFQVEPDDARVLARSFGPALDESDLRSLPAYEVAMRLCVGGQTARPVTGRTRPLPDATADGAALRQSSRDRHGTVRSAVEVGLHERLIVPGRRHESFGHRRVGGES